MPNKPFKSPAEVSNALATAAFSKLLRRTRSAEFLDIQKTILRENISQHAYLDFEKFHKYCERFNIRLIPTIEYHYFLLKGWLKPSFTKTKSGNFKLPPSTFKTKSEKRLKESFFHPYQILEIANCYSLGRQVRDSLMIWWLRKRKKKQAFAYVEQFGRMLGGMHNPENLSALVELGIVLEPIYRPHIRKSTVIRGARIANEASHFEIVDDLKKRVRRLFKGFTKDNWKQLHNRVNFISKQLYDGAELKTLVTLMRSEDQEAVKGSLGAALVAREIAHLLRYFASDMKVALEEEQFSESPGFTDAYFDMFRGSKNIFDGPRENRLRFVRDFGLDYGIRVRVYVEGATEAACFNSILGQHGFVEVIDLTGTFWQRNGRGLAFRDSLRSDKSHGIFSLIVLDGDRSDNIRVVKDAAQSGDFLGEFYINQPDFELENFSRSELARILTKLVGAKVPTQLLANVTSTKDIFKRLHHEFPTSRSISKGEVWGAALSAYAHAHPKTSPLGLLGDRKINQVLRFCLFASQMNFASYVKSSHVDSATGKMIVRE